MHTGRARTHGQTGLGRLGSSYLMKSARYDAPLKREGRAFWHAPSFLFQGTLNDCHTFA